MSILASNKLQTNRKLAWLDLARIGAIFCALLAVMSGHELRAQTISQYSNTTAGAITDNNCGTAAQITRTFNVPTSFIVADVDLGVFLTHTYRSDLRITLTSPTGTTVQVMTWTGNVQSGDNLNDRFDDEATAMLTTHNPTVADPLTPAPPPYSHSFQPSAPLSAFDGQSAAGNWTMVLCDGVGTDVGNFTRADLFLTPTSLSVTKTSSIIGDGVSGANPKSIPGATIRYCILVSNDGGATHSNVTPLDPVPANASFVTGSLRTGASCAGATIVEDDDNAGADESDPFGASITSNTVRGSAPSLAAGSTFALVFDAIIN
jgi:uncharacterized repeat protein (TIGR01451 family)